LSIAFPQSHFTLRLGDNSDTLGSIRTTPMIALELYVNDKKVATAAVEHGVISAIINWIRLRHDGGSWHSGVSIAGLDDTTSEHLKWFRQDLVVGDEIRIKLVETDQIDTPIEREPK
jgi:hypothetical protein